MRINKKDRFKRAGFSVLQAIYFKYPKEMSDLNSLRTEIRKILSEMIQLNEAQKTPEVDTFINSYFTKANFFVEGQPVASERASLELSAECAHELKTVINQIQSGNLPYENFYILKLSNFLLKTPSGYAPLTFENPDTASNSVFKEIATSFIVYVYHDTIFRVLPYNENFHTDTRIESEANKFIKSPEFDVLFGTRTQRAKFVGEIKTLYFEKKIRVFTSYFNPATTNQTDDKQKGDYAKFKKMYRPNTPLIHKIFGKGIIKTTKKVKDQGEGNYYILDVDFPNYGTKRIKMKAAA